MKPLIIPLILITGLFACNKKQRTTLISSPDYEKAESFRYQKDDSAYYYFNRVTSASTDSLQIARAYNNMAAIQSDAGDYFGSQESLLSSLRYLDEGKEDHFYCLSSDYNELGTISLNLKNYAAALRYYDLAIKFAQDTGFKLIFLNNEALVYQKTRSFQRAIAIYDSIIKENPEDKRTYARMLSNRARTKWLRDPGYNAAPELQTALQIRLNEKDDWGQNASYSHLSDYYAHLLPDSALIYATKMYATARYLDSPDDEVEALQKLISLSPPQDLKKYFTRYQYLNDSLQTSRNNAKNQFALIRYDAEKNKVENLKLQQENANKKYQIIKQRIIIYGTILALCLFIVWYGKRKQQLVLAAQSTIRENQLKTSQKVHDVVANGLYRIMTEIEHQPTIERDSLIDKIEVLYEQSRDISYEQPTSPAEDYQAEVAKLLTSFATDTTRVVIAGNNKDVWEKAGNTVKQELKYILQELMVNMKKHSNASTVAIKFEQSNNQISIYYTDNGVGIAPQQSFGNGLTNTGNRIKNINGKITFTSNTTTGLKIHVSFPTV